MQSEIIAQLESVEKVYGAGKVPLVALNGVSLEVRQRDFTVLVGPSGAGKSTLLNVLGTLDRPSRGRVVIQGVDVGTQTDASLSRLRLGTLGFIFQSFNLVEVLTVFENIEYPLRLAGVSASKAEERVMWLLEQVGLSDRADHRMTQLSGGQRQRVAIARALANSPSLVLADEPTANLDSKTGDSILALMKHLNEVDGATFFIATHDQRVQRHATKVVRLVDGRLEDVRREEVGHA